jgi:hypothetical protein
MKSIPLKSCLCAILAAATLMTIGLLPAVGASLSPVGTWDCVISGNRQGIAYFQFSDDGTFVVTEMIVPNPPPTPPNPSEDRGGEGTGRGESGSTNTFTPSQQIFGSEETNGMWALDPKGRTIGFFEETSAQVSCTVTTIPYSTNNAPSSFSFSTTNGATTDPTFCITIPTATNDAVITETTTCFSNIPVCTALSNAVSFVGTVSAKRIVLKCTTPFGNTTYEGVPIQDLPDFSGSYSGVRKQGGVTYQELFTLTADGSVPNMYDVSLTGPGYSYLGESLISSQKKIAFVLGQVPPIPTNAPTVIRAVTGPFNSKKGSAATVGWDQPGGVLENREHFNTQQVP